MLFLHKKKGTIRRLFAGLVVALISFSIAFAEPAYAKGMQPSMQSSDAYIAPNGTDLRTVADCIPPRLSSGNLQRALRESGNDFLEKVFETKDSYYEYELDDAEIEFLECLKRHGVKPNVEKE